MRVVSRFASRLSKGGAGNRPCSRLRAAKGRATRSVSTEATSGREGRAYKRSPSRPPKKDVAFIVCGCKTGAGQPLLIELSSSRKDEIAQRQRGLRSAL